MRKIDIGALALAFGVSWSFLVLLTGWAGMIGWGEEVVRLMGRVYIGMTPSFFGAIIGAVWGFLDGAIWGAVIGYVYNRVAKQQ